MVESLKRGVRILEAALTPRHSSCRFDGHDLRFVHSLWWHDADQASFDDEIVPYFQAIGLARRYRTVCDAGASSGMFSVAASLRFPGAQIHAFEPSRRQRVMLRRNLRLNGVHQRVQIVPAGLWRTSGRLEFRTHGAIGALRDASMLPPTLAFEERVPVCTLDEWVHEASVGRLDLIKMDIEGAELEALDGSRATLARDRPDLVIQAYHVRQGRRTFERCEEFLRALGYVVREAAPPGLLHAVSPS